MALFGEAVGLDARTFPVYREGIALMGLELSKAYAESDQQGTLVFFCKADIEDLPTVSPAFLRPEALARDQFNMRQLFLAMIIDPFATFARTASEVLALRGS